MSGHGGHTRAISVAARFATAVAALIAIAAIARDARAEDPTRTQPTQPPAAIDGDTTAPPPDLTPAWAANAVPPPLNTPYLQYGVAFTAELVTTAGNMCASTSEPCILGPGGGIAMRVGRRSAGPWWFGGAYELTKQDPNNLYRLGTLQQLRAEMRYYVTTGYDTQPFASLGGGIAAYGNELGIDTFGPMLSAAIGAETQLTRQTVVGIAFAYRVIAFKGFLDSSNTARDAGVAQIFGIGIALEGRDPL